MEMRTIHNILNLLESWILELNYQRPQLSSNYTLADKKAPFSGPIYFIYMQF